MALAKVSWQEEEPRSELGTQSILGLWVVVLYLPCYKPKLPKQTRAGET